MQQALSLVASEEIYTEVLELDFEPREEGQPSVLQVATPNPILESAIQKSKEWHIEGDVPPPISRPGHLQFTCIQLLMSR